IQTYLFVPAQPKGEVNLQMADPTLKDECSGDPLRQTGQGQAAVPTAPVRPAPLQTVVSGPPKAAASGVDASSVDTSTICISDMNDEQLLALSKGGLLSLNLAEMQAIQQHYQAQKREPTDVELETLAQTWSEHCSHKTFKASINYSELDQQGHVIETET